MRRSQVHPSYAEGRAQLTIAFRALKQEKGFARARSNFSCCSSCALAELHGEGLRESDKVVFYHRQDADFLRRTGEVYLRFSGPAGTGEEIVEAMAARGLVVEWNGSSNTAILVTL